MKKFKYIIAIISVFFFFTLNVSADENVNRVINIVYDDSSSMIYNYKEREYVDYWARAKFSLELLCSSLDDFDTINIYPMSDYSDLENGILTIEEYNIDKEPYLSLDGSMSADERVNKINNMVTEALDTPFYAVGKAFYDLTKEDADERWLVILTDGEFDEVISDQQLSEQFSGFHEYDDDIKIMYIGMDSSVFKVESDYDNGLYTEYADNPDEILDTFTKVSYRIFNRNELEVSNNNRIIFDVPMDKLVIFAKGNDVSVNSIINPNGIVYKPSAEVNIPSSDIVSSNYADNNRVKYNDSLTGELAVFEYDISEGNYRIDVDNAEDVEVFYYPSVGVTVKLTGTDGVDVYGDEEIKSGKYKIEYEFINTISGEKLYNTDLLGEIQFTTSLVRNGEIINENISDNDEIKLEPGLEELIVRADYLNYNSIEAKFEFNVVDYHPLIYNITEMPQYSITFTGIDNIEKPIVISVEFTDQQLTEELWESLPLPQVISLNTSDSIFFDVKKSDELGFYNIYLNEDLSSFNADNSNEFYISGEYEKNQIYYSGQLNGIVMLSDSIPVFIRTLYNYRYLVISLIVILILVVVLMRKELPNVIYFKLDKVLIDGTKSNQEIGFEYDKKNKQLIIKVYSVFGEAEYVKFNLLATEPMIIAMITRPKSILISNIETSDRVKDIIIDKESYVKLNDVWIDSKNPHKPKSIKSGSNKIIIRMTNGVELKIYGTLNRY